MFARLVEAMPTTVGLAHEPQWDGYRLIVFASRTARATAIATVYEAPEVLLRPEAAGPSR